MLQAGRDLSQVVLSFWVRREILKRFCAEQREGGGMLRREVLPPSEVCWLFLGAREPGAAQLPAWHLPVSEVRSGKSGCVCNLSLFCQNSLCASGCFPTGKSPVSVWHSHNLSGLLIPHCHTSTCLKDLLPLLWPNSDLLTFPAHHGKLWPLLLSSNVWSSHWVSPSSAFHISQIWTAFSGKALIDYFLFSSPSPYSPTPYIIFSFWIYLAAKIMLPSLILSSASCSSSDSCSTVQNHLVPYTFPTTVKGVHVHIASFIFSQICSSVFPTIFSLSNGHLDLDDQTNCFCCSHINP